MAPPVATPAPAGADTEPLKKKDEKKDEKKDKTKDKKKDKKKSKKKDPGTKEEKKKKKKVHAQTSTPACDTLASSQAHELSSFIRTGSQ